MDFYILRTELLHYSVQQTADLLGLSTQTIHTYDSKKIIPAKHIFLYLEMISGSLDQFGLIGWRINQAKLVSPENIVFDVNEIRALPYLYALISELQRSPVENEYHYGNIISIKKKLGR
jgi:hypothetical protein